VGRAWWLRRDERSTLAVEETDLVRAQREMVGVLLGESDGDGSAQESVRADSWSEVGTARFRAATRVLAEPADDVHTWPDLSLHSKDPRLRDHTGAQRCAAVRPVRHRAVHVEGQGDVVLDATSSSEPIGCGKANRPTRPCSSSDWDIADFRYRQSALDSPTFGRWQACGAPLGCG
jgi:hypothetical protein